MFSFASIKGNHSRSIALSLVLLSALLLFISQQSTNKKDIAHSFEQYLQQDYVKVTDVIQQYIKNEDKTALNAIATSPFFIEVYKNDTIVYWTDRAELNENSLDKMLDIKTIGDSVVNASIRLNFSDFDGNTSKANNVENHKKYIGVISKSTEQDNDAFKIKVADQVIYIQVHSIRSNGYIKGIAWLLLFLTLIFSTLQLMKNYFVTNNGHLSKSLSWFIVLLPSILFKILCSLHFIAYIFDDFSGFDTINHTSYLAPNLIGFVVNLWIFGLCIYLATITLYEIKSRTFNPNMIAVIAGFMTFFLFGISTHIIDGYVISEHVNLEIESLLQFNGVSFTLIVCFAILMILIFQATHLIYEVLNRKTSYYRYFYTGLGWMLAFGLLWLMNGFHVPLLIFTIFIAAYSLILDAYVDSKDKKITYLIWWLIMFSGFLAVCLFYFGLLKDIKGRQHFINEYYTQPDSKIVKSLSDLEDTLANSNIFSKIASLDGTGKLDLNDLDQYINQKTSLASFALDRSLELFDKKGNTLFSHHFANFHKTNQSLKNAHRVAKNIYHNPFEDKYIIRFEIDITHDLNNAWYLFVHHQHIDVARKAYIEENLHRYSFAVFKQNKLIEKNEAHQAMPDIMQFNALDTAIIQNGYSYVISKPSDDYKIVSYKKVSGLIKPISLFSFIFTLSGLILLFLSFVNTRYDFLPENLSMKFGSKSSLKTKIQFAIILLILTTFLIIGAITAYYFKNLIEVNQKSKNKEESISIINNIDSDIQNLPDNATALQFLNSKLKEFSIVHDKELSLFDADGALVGSSIKGINQVRLPFQWWNTMRYNDTQAENEITFYSDLTEFVPIYHSDNRPIAYIEIAHKSYNNSSISILDFLSTILNAYIFLFLIAGAIAITIANSITQPLSILTDKLKKFKLGKTNELLEWNSNDEIGTLIHDYNNLTHELERSAGIIAKTERDMAWREMAKQVAHEIKNPLTPMKLSIQYLDRTAKDYPEKAQELIPRISSTLIEQIDNLTQIANEFSNFATMPQATNEKIILNEIVETIHDLFRKRDDMDINMIETIDDLYVFADRNHLVRILNNLLKNAIQAIPDNRRGKIEIELKRNDNDALVRVSDNGTGIPDHMKDKVFTPNFTTKSSGTGLGLAISANMIESFNGKIYFETKVGQGTDFYVSIPLMRLDDYFGDELRVSLD